MIGQTEREEIIRLINDEDVDLNLLSFELDIPIEEINAYKAQLELRKFAKEAIKSGKIEDAILRLNNFIESAENSIVEKAMLLKLKAYVDRANVSESDLEEIEKERKSIGLTTSIDEILELLGIQIPKRKASNLRKKEKQVDCEQESRDTLEEVSKESQEQSKSDYSGTIEKYKEEISKNPKDLQNKRNLLAFAYFKAGRIDEARDELLSLVDERSSFMAYRLLIHLEKCEGNFEDARLWAYDCLDKYPGSTNALAIRQQLVEMARKEGNRNEVIAQLREIINIHPEHKSANKMLKSIQKEGR